MKDFWSSICLALLLAGCASMPTQPEHWREFTTRIDDMTAAELQAAREALAESYRTQPDDALRLRHAYVLSRAEPSLQQLHRARGILAEVDVTGEHATVRHMLDQQIELLIQLQETRGEVLQLKTHLESLKKIETDLSRAGNGPP